MDWCVFFFSVHYFKKFLYFYSINITLLKTRLYKLPVLSKHGYTSYVFHHSVYGVRLRKRFFFSSLINVVDLDSRLFFLITFFFIVCIHRDSAVDPGFDKTRGGGAGFWGVWVTLYYTLYIIKSMNNNKNDLSVYLYVLVCMHILLLLLFFYFVLFLVKKKGPRPSKSATGTFCFQVFISWYLFPLV